MGAVDSVLRYRCNGCGHNYDEANYCCECGTPRCPNCRRTSCIVDVIEMARMVSHSSPLMKKEMKSKKGSSKPRSKMSDKDRVAVLLSRMGRKS